MNYEKSANIDTVHKKLSNLVLNAYLQNLCLRFKRDQNHKFLSFFNITLNTTAPITFNYNLF